MNSAIVSGGAISVLFGRLELFDCTFRSIMALQDGGAIMVGTSIVNTRDDAQHRRGRRAACASRQLERPSDRDV
jgi:hypothetical protein